MADARCDGPLQTNEDDVDYKTDTTSSTFTTGLFK
jgi:hypothetical protein